MGKDMTQTEKCICGRFIDTINREKSWVSEEFKLMILISGMVVFYGVLGSLIVYGAIVIFR